MELIALQSLLTILSHVVFIGISIWAMGTLTLSQRIKKLVGQENKANVLIFFSAVAIGYTVSQFFIDLVFNSQNLLYLIR